MKESIENTFLNLSSALSTSKKNVNKMLGDFKGPNELNRSLKGVPAYKFFSFCEELGIDPGRLLDGKVNFETLKQHWLGNLEHIPEKYSGYKSSRARTALGAFEYLEKLSPYHYLRILKKLQLSESYFNSPEKKISVKIIDDFYDEMSSLGYVDQHFQNLAYKTATSFKKSKDFYSKFKSCKTKKKLFEKFFDDEIKYLDQNWDYVIENSTENGILIKVQTQKQLQDEVKSQKFGSWGFTMHRSGFVKGISTFLDKNPLEVNLIKTIHQGDQYCLYELNY